MEIFIESIDRGTWDAIINDLFIPKHVVGNELVEKPLSEFDMIAWLKAS